MIYYAFFAQRTKIAMDSFIYYLHGNTPRIYTFICTENKYLRTIYARAKLHSAQLLLQYIVYKCILCTHILARFCMHVRSEYVYIVLTRTCMCIFWQRESLFWCLNLFFKDDIIRSYMVNSILFRTIFRFCKWFAVN